MGEPNAGGSGGRGGGGGITSDFPAGREPERKPEAGKSFEAASFTDAQAEQDRARKAQLECERAKLQPEMHLRPGGELEQAVHEEVETNRELEIGKLQARIERHKDRKRGRGGR